MKSPLRTATVLLLALTVLTGVVYPLVVTAIGQVVFARSANGSLIRIDQRVVGSEWIGQSFSRPEYFWGRRSATSPVAYNAAASGGSNDGPLFPGLRQAAAARVDALRDQSAPERRVPVDLVTASASGLDPHISPAAAEWQVARVAAARQMDEDAVRSLVRQCTEGRQLGLFGEPRVHVLRLNLALDQHSSVP